MKNKKGFTIVEMLAVIVIISILSMLAIPNVTSNVTQSRKKAFSEDAKTILSIVRSNYASGSYDLIGGVDESKQDQVIYQKEAIDTILTSRLVKSPLGGSYSDASVLITKSRNLDGTTKYSYSVCLIDTDKNAFEYANENSLNPEGITLNSSMTNCQSIPVKHYSVYVNVSNGSIVDSDYSPKRVNEGEDVTFNLAPSEEGLEGLVHCTNNQTGTINNNVLTVSNVTDNTICDVVFDYGGTTVLYPDGTLIINEKLSDRANNIERHGGNPCDTCEYEPFSEKNNYIFSATFTGGIGDVDTPWADKVQDIYAVEIGQKIKPVSTAYWFANTYRMSRGNFTNLDTSEVTSMSAMFYDSGNGRTGDPILQDNRGNNNLKPSFLSTPSSNTEYKYTYILTGLDTWKTSKVEDMSYMFYFTGSAAHEQWDIGNLAGWDVSHVYAMDYMFGYAANSLGSGWVASNYESKKDDFVNLSNSDLDRYMYNLSEKDDAYLDAKFKLKGLNGWNTSNVLYMTGMFYSTGSRANDWSIGDLSGWNVGNVREMSDMFALSGAEATNWSIGNLSNWDLKNVEFMNQMFANAGSSTTNWSIGDISNWNVSKVREMYSLFQYAASQSATFNIGDIGKWDVSKVVGMASMFYNTAPMAATWYVGDLSKWTTSSLENINTMFYMAGGNDENWNIGNIGTWDVSGVGEMYRVFYHCATEAKTINFDLSNWDVSHVYNMQDMFNLFAGSATSWSIGDLSNWDTRNVENMTNMFYFAGRDSETIVDLGTLNVYATSINRMFYYTNRLKVTLNIHNKPTSYNNALYSAATGEGGMITINYTSAVTNIDSIIATKSNTGSHITRGSIIE